MQFEICIGTLEGALLADKYGVDRVELCSALYEGGLTPSVGLTRVCVTQSKQSVYAMIRPEAGGFTYSKAMIKAMKTDIASMAEIGVAGVVFGVLKKNKEIDLEINAMLAEVAKSHEIDIVFHRAFDFCPDPIEGLEQLIEMGFDRVLTSGQKPKAIDGKSLITKLVKQADGRIEVMAGSGVAPENAKELISTGVDALHFTAGKFEEVTQLGMGARIVLDEHKVAGILKFKK